MIDFSPSPQQQALAEEVRSFVKEKIVPYESDPRWGSHGPNDELRRELNAEARQAGLLSVHVEPEYGGRGLSHVENALVFTAAGYSPLGPGALHCNAPDEGNIHLLSQVATPAQKERWLKPLATAETRSCFLMTEPEGAGADPSLLATEALPQDGGYRITGRKWFITGAEGASLGIVMAQVPDKGATMFLTDMTAPGIALARQQNTLDATFTGGHYEVTLKEVFVPEDQVLGSVGEGFRYAQVRLAPARLTHCMRWLGAAERAHDIASAYAARRRAFGKALGDHEGVGFQLADNEMELTQSRLWIWYTAWMLDRGEKARHESSMSKVAVSEALFRIVDRCVQILGGVGVTHDTVVAQLFNDIRAFRIYDGPSEVHRWAIAKRIMRQQGVNDSR
ncbi:MAG: acyl-CoA dehydrogenase family protein [Rhodospirillales bacterium]